MLKPFPLRGCGIKTLQLSELVKRWDLTKEYKGLNDANFTCSIINHLVNLKLPLYFRLQNRFPYPRNNYPQWVVLSDSKLFCAVPTTKLLEVLRKPKANRQSLKEAILTTLRNNERNPHAAVIFPALDFTGECSKCEFILQLDMESYDAVEAHRGSILDTPPMTIWLRVKKYSGQHLHICMFRPLLPSGESKFLLEPLTHIMIRPNDIYVELDDVEHHEKAKDGKKQTRSHALHKVIAKTIDKLSANSEKPPSAKAVWDDMREQEGSLGIIQEMTEWGDRAPKIQWISNNDRAQTMGKRTFENYVSKCKGKK